MSAQDFVRQLADQLAAETAGPRDVSAHADLIGTWHWTGSVCLSLPGETEGFGPGEVTRYGREFMINEQRLRNSFDRLGNSSLIEMLSDESIQLARFGEIVARRGPWPEGVLRFRPGTHEAIHAAQEDRKRAWAIADLDARAAELSRLAKLHGTDYWGEASRSGTIVSYDGGAGREDSFWKISSDPAQQ